VEIKFYQVCVCILLREYNDYEVQFAKNSPHAYTQLDRKAATDLELTRLEQPRGFTEPLLHAWRLMVKAGEA
jgi:malate synthase